MSKHITLSQLNETIKDALLDAFPTTVWVIAEVSELKENRSGHCYLELIEKEGNDIIARTRATIWSYTFRMLKPYFETSTGQHFQSGIKILVQVSVEYHEAYGLSLNVKDIDPTYTIGDLALQRKQILDQLKSDGVFEMNKELELPLVPQKIAVISSATAAGFQDFMDQLEGNEYGFKFYTKLFEATMQGAETVPTIINALERIFQYDDFFEAVVIIRGGGATADLSSFDNYDLAYNITQFPLPVITGIGHEKDDTVIDLVAHTRLKTPTAVAEFLISGMARYFEKLLSLESEIVNLVTGKLETEKIRLNQNADRMQYSVSDFIYEKRSDLSNKGNNLKHVVGNFVFRKKYTLNGIKHDLESAVSLQFLESKNKLVLKQRRLKRVVGESLLKENAKINHFKDILKSSSNAFIFKAREKIHINENVVRLLDPENVLMRGYSLTLKEGRIIKSTKELGEGEEIETRFSDGMVKSKITSKK